ncbi:WD40 repeat-like protein [Plenodomus tracheiphilus IPT5]|uniref:WD40 repeat-like protein n=1 Tax=Plenodomus tracheiphilus IPT5 TaxID=1408161 RepID=A0A6A7B7G4_9PLEO|nr:WD40 repeat-like protein [Plenodomus tracheiphilus IPT5]
MRLLERISGEDFVLTKDFIGDDEIPPYAILSHTWKDGEEVTLDELMNGTGKRKRGYNKIQFCGQQAKRDGLRYFWVDTCCIDKSNQVELQDAINSMFRWYQNATRCYVYLSDVSAIKRKAGSELSEYTWEQSFYASKWFTRGWTLQELLAPRFVTFFSVEGKPLGDKGSLERQISEITGIPTLALQGAPLHEFSVEERISWAKNRQTMRKEDKAYSLLGIFSIFMSLIYGEGEKNALKRLRKKLEKPSEALLQQHALVQSENEDRECIKNLRSTDPRDDKKRIEDTKGGLLEDSYRWILENSEFQQWRDGDQDRLLWIKGDPGKGKTMLLCGMTNELKRLAPTHLLSFFFCQATDPRINNATAVLRGLIYMLVVQCPSLIRYVREKYDHAGKALFEDANTWAALSAIFMNLLKDPNLNRTYLIIDALDECEGWRKLLDLIAQTVSTSSCVKWIVSSRNRPNIEERLERAGQKVKLCLELNALSVSAAVGAFIHHKVRQLTERKNYDDQTRNTVLAHLSANAHDTFLWVALVCQNLEEVPRRNTIRKLHALPPGLDSLYEQMMQKLCSSDDADICKEILAVAAIIYRPIAVEELVTLAELPKDMADGETIREIISSCGSFLTLRENIIYFVHQSAKDFLLSKASKDIFPSGKEEVHHVLFTRSLQAMSVTLKRDMYSLYELGCLVNEIKQPSPDPLLASRYSCVYWVDHLCSWNPDSSAAHLVDLQDGGSVDKFMRQKFLYWLEALSLCKTISNGVVSMAKLESLIYKRAGASATLQLVQDARRFIMSHKGAIENAPLQAYVSAIVFSPTQSLIRNLFQHEAPRWLTIKPAMTDNWGACLQTLEGHDGWVNSVAFSHDSTWIASGSDDSTVKIWDASSGECLQTLEGHSSGVNSVVFSHDSTRIASGSRDSTVKIWDASSGDCLQTLKDHIGRVNSVVFSYNSTWIASASYDKTVKIWDASSGDCLQTLEGHNGQVLFVTFSHNSTQIASASGDHTVKIWDASSGDCLQTLKGHSNAVTSVVFSYDSIRIASGSHDSTVKIWDASSGDCLQTLKGYSSAVSSVAFSHDSAQIASALHNSIVKIWDASSSDCLQTLEGHSDGVKSVVFSHDSTRIASASYDRTVKIWNASSNDYLQTLESHNDSVSSVAFSHDSTWIASGSHDRTVKIWDASSGACLWTLEGHDSWVNSVVFSHNSTWIASASYDKTVKIWDASSGDCLQTLKGHSGTVWLVAFSHDSTWIASGSHDCTVKIWDASSGECLQTLNGHSSEVRLAVFSHDSTQIASGSYDTTVKIWNTSSGDCLQTLKGHSLAVSSVAFYHDSTWIASASYDRTVKIWDASSGNCQQTLEVGRRLYDLSFDSTGYYLYNKTDAIVISNFTTPNWKKVVMEPQSPYQYTALSLDNTWITYNLKRVLWLPSEYRPLSPAIFGRMIGIGVSSGKMWICHIDL